MQAIVKKLFWAFVLCVACVSQTAAENYKVGPGDKLNVSILGQNEFSRVTEVRGDGSFQLHKLGKVQAAGHTLAEIEDIIIKRADELFDGSVSVVVEMAEYRPIFVMGNVQTPGSYPYARGMTVIQAIALAGGYERGRAETTNERNVLDVQQRALEARIRLGFAENRLKAITAELARLEGREAQGDAAAPEDIDPDQVELLTKDREILNESIEGFTRREALANAEAELYAQRRELIARQLQVTEEQLADINSLVAQGLSRRDRLVELKVEADNFRSDELQTTAYAARAEQTAVNARNESDVALARYHRDLLSGKIAAEERIQLLRSQLNASMDYLRQVSPTAAMAVNTKVETVFEVYRAGTKGQPEQVDLTSEIQPGDVLVVKFEEVTN
ncbi:hypothetical protein AVO45_09460 [Ruegeria marisrubri]|uniref:Uncharacterized protein n=1 Tax=Ruegeria marisrubri TaxID=1685379 RepID=A0A0X3TQZ6_9RHOB|nr:polysaccharide biosynthesis/export family protein [Ruegeria marisrubri]KUJ78165.1 hypothetical protein AVO45_09460 [Ruegeria marisrubri]